LTVQNKTATPESAAGRLPAKSLWWFLTKPWAKARLTIKLAGLIREAEASRSLQKSKEGVFHQSKTATPEGAAARLKLTAG
jgi:hypothetical protein